MANYNNSASKLKVLSANVNGLGGNIKRRAFFDHVEKADSDIICLVDTRFSDNTQDYIRNETNRICYFNNFNNQNTASRGVAILVRKSCPIKITMQNKDNNGNLLWVKCEYEGREFLLCVLYGPSEDDPYFFQNLFDYYSQSGISDVILCGDFNVTLDHTKDNRGYAQPRGVRSRETLNSLMNETGIIDVFRAIHGRSKQYTWARIGGAQRARLDMFLSSETIRPFITAYEKYPAYKSDHSPIIITIDFSNFNRGKGLWKLNGSLLKEIEYVNRINKSIRNTLAKYVKHELHDNFYTDASPAEFDDFMSIDPGQLSNYEYKIDPHLVLEMILNDARNESISYSTAKKKLENQAATDLLNNLKRLQELNSTVTDPNIRADLAQAELDYNQFIEAQSLGKFFSNRVLSKISGEKPSKFFLNLEKNMSAQRYISRLEVKDVQGNEVSISDQKSIEVEIRKYYENLYENKDDLITSSIDDFIEPNSTFTSLTELQSNDMESEIQLSELSCVLKKNKNDSSPGSTGFTFGFYKTFWRYIGAFLCQAANHSFSIDKLPLSQTIGLINLLPKGDKPKEFLSNWRPITILNCGYKLISGVIAKRINSVLPILIHPDQSGFVKGRYIGDSIRNTYDTLQYAKANNLSGLLLLIDFEKAFDSISFKYIQKTLKFFGFGTNLTKWVGILLNNFRAAINHAGNISELFNILRGCRQGDPIASCLFILSIEILCIKLRSSREVQGFKIDTLEVLLSMYADDCSIFLNFSEQNLRNVIGILTDFYKISGLKIQMQKTQCIVFGKIPRGNYKICPDLNLRWEQDFKLLGVNLNGTLSNIDENFSLKMNEIRGVIKTWHYRFISPIGRACIAKTLLLSKLSHLAFTIPSLSKNCLKKLESEIYEFIWKGREKVARADAKQPETRGGLGFPDIESSWTSYKFAWFRRMISSESIWKKIFEINLSRYSNTNIDDFFQTMGTVEYNKLAKKITNPFWSQCLLSIKPLMQGFLKNHPEKLLSYPIWGSNLFVRNSNLCNRNAFRNVGRLITYPAEIIKYDNLNAEFLSSDEFESRFGQVPDHESYTSLKLVITYAAQKLGTPLFRMEAIYPVQPPFLQLINQSTKGCNKWSKIIKNLCFTNQNLEIRERKWETELGHLQGNFFWEKMYSMTKQIFYDNKLKYFQYQLVRGTLKTNRIISKFIPGINSQCTFCDQAEEYISHLFYECTFVVDFLDEVYRHFSHRWTEIDIKPNKKDYLFGVKTKNNYDPENFLGLYSKYFIWIMRCRKVPPTLNAFVSWFRIELKINHLAFGSDPRLHFLNIAQYRDEILPIL